MTYQSFAARALVILFAAALSQDTLVISNECKCTGYFVISNATTIKNHSLTEFVGRSLAVEHGFSDCFTKCIEEDCACVSFNYQRNPRNDGSHLCELSYEDKVTKPTALMRREGWDYYDIIEVNPSYFYSLPHTLLFWHILTHGVPRSVHPERQVSETFSYGFLIRGLSIAFS